MENTLQSFEKKLDELRHYIQGLELESCLVSFEIDKKPQTECESLVSEYQKHILVARKKKRQFEYNSIIVSLYGFLEQFDWDLIRRIKDDPSWDEFFEEIERERDRDQIWTEGGAAWIGRSSARISDKQGLLEPEILSYTQSVQMSDYR